MFRQRTSSQKPGNDVVANFRQQYPDVTAVTPERSAPTIDQPPCAVDSPTINLPTPRASHEQWRFTPSLLDPNSYTFNAFANEQPTLPTPGGNKTLFHSQAGDLHTPILGAGGIGTPLFMPTFDDALQPGSTVMGMSELQTLQPHQSHHYHPDIQGSPVLQPFAPSSFDHQNIGNETMNQDGVTLETVSAEHRLPSMAPAAPEQHMAASIMPMSQAPLYNAEKFRFHSTLNAPTAMIKHADEIPVTYLNKGQAYLLSVVDTNRTVPIQPATKYRTFVRVSFEEEWQRQKPSGCWSLWGNGRGVNEADQRGGKLQAVEYVEADETMETSDEWPRIELESSSFDGFCVTWTPRASGSPEINLAVRFNFLSTDFSHSKGVKGTPVRFCAKTSLVPPDGSPKDACTSLEVCFCKVKLFRDHGAERKRLNDVAHVKKSLNKMKQQLANMESGMDVGKKKRNSNVVKGNDYPPSKLQKHKRTWPVSSTSPAGGGTSRISLEEELQIQLQTLQDMFTSTRPISILSLRGEDLDDPDHHPVSLPAFLDPNWQARSRKSSVTGSMISLSPSSQSLTSQASGMWQSMDNTTSAETFEQVSRINRVEDTDTLSRCIEAVGVDPSYRPPAAKNVEKPAACFYVQHQNKSEQENPTYYRAIYLSKRTVEEFNTQIARKWGVEPAKVLRSIHVTHEGLEAEMDNAVIRELEDGQDMRLEIEEVIEQLSPAKPEWEMSIDETTTESEDVAPPTQGFELRLVF